MEKKSTSNKIKKGKTEEEIKEVKIFDNFALIKKEKKPDETERIEKRANEFNLKGRDFWEIYDKPTSKKSDKSRFADFFNKIKEEEDNNKQKNTNSKKEEDLKKEDSSLQKNTSINSSSITTNNDSKIFEGASFNNSLFEKNTNINQIIVENKKDEKKEKVDELNLNIVINKVISMEDLRTTIMIKNIPNKFNRDLLLTIINQNFKGTYDLFILPTDINKSKNFGYAFINFTSSYYIPYFYYMFNGKMWSSTNSKKICELIYSKVQGKANILRHFPSTIVYLNEEAFSVKSEQKYIIPNVYKIIFNKFFPGENIEEFKFYFITRMPDLCIIK